MNAENEDEEDEEDEKEYRASVIYLSNDESEEEFILFYGSTLCDYCFTLPFNDERIFKIKDQFKIEGVPQVLVLDKNLDVITHEGAHDLLNLTPFSARSVWI